MSPFWLDYAAFALKGFTIIVFILLIIAAIIIVVGGTIEAIREDAGSNEKRPKLVARLLNQDFAERQHALDIIGANDKRAKEKRKIYKARIKSLEDTLPEKPRLFILEFDGDIHAGAVSELRELVSLLILQSTTNDEVILKLESGGGTVNGYGLAAAQLARLREAGIPLTICIDKIATSGGYMMAAVANKILASPFAIIGSIGVVTSLPNFHRWLKDKNIDYEQLTAGEYKRTLTMFGENTDEDREKVTAELEQVLALFKSHIHQYRPQVNIDAVATGEYWQASDTLDKQLIDMLITSDSYILQHLETHQLIALSLQQPKSLVDKVTQASLKIKKHLRAGW